MIHLISRVFCCLDFSKVFWAAMNFYGCFFWQQFRDIATELDLHQSFFTSLLLLYLVKIWNAQLCSIDWHQTKRGQKWGEFLTFQAISDACLLKNTVDSFKTLSVSASLLLTSSVLITLVSIHYCKVRLVWFFSFDLKIYNPRKKYWLQKINCNE